MHWIQLRLNLLLDYGNGTTYPTEAIEIYIHETMDIEDKRVLLQSYGRPYDCCIAL